MGIVSNTRVALLLRSALDLMSKGSNDGRRWVKGTEVSDTPVIGNLYGYCAIGAIRNVEGFTVAERRAAEKALAEMVLKCEGDRAGDVVGYSLEDVRGRDTDSYVFEEVITAVNDAEETRWENVRNWFTRAAARAKS